jgi:dTDP-4-dehydrorhamnose 3,5-epimerase
VRGLHFQIGAGVAKLVRCGRGRIFDVAVDLRAGSPTYGQWEGVELDEESMRELYVPVGFAHGFCVLSEVADVSYKQTAYYDAELERGIAWNDPDIAIDWPLPASELIVSERDGAAPRLSEIADSLPFRFAG